jgi:hypothetical protein
MRYDCAYEVVDSRRVSPDKRLGVIAALRPIPGGFELVSFSGGLVVDDSFGFDDDHRNGIVALSNAEGRVTLTVLDMDRYRGTVEPFVRGMVPEFRDEREMHAGLLGILLESD